jgi:ABC-type Fe3+-hydroxamate transport system substrate-binding protein
MSLYKEIEPFVDYIHSIRKLKNYLSFDVLFPSKWLLPKSLTEEGQLVPFQAEDNNMKGLSFVSQINENEITQTLLKIAKIIKLNKEREMKEQLFKQTVEELKKAFEKNDLEKLQGLYFDFSPEIDDTPNLDDYDTEEPTSIELAE